MGVRVFLIAVIAYALGMLDTVGLVGRYFMHDEPARSETLGYAQVYKRWRWHGVGYLALADFLRSLVVVLFGGLLMKGVGFPSIGKQLGMFFALLGQCMPLLRRFRPREDLIFPALLLLLIDWRVFLVCVIAGLLLMVFTGSRELMISAALLLHPILLAVFGGWWLKVLLAVFSSYVIFHIYHVELLRCYRKLIAGFRSRRAASPQAQEAPQDEADDR